MERLKTGWYKVPHHIRKPIVLLFGAFFIVAAGLTGWLPGPGGVPLFLIGIAILSTEFLWAKRLRDAVLKQVHAFGHWYRRHKIIGTLFLIVCAVSAISFGTFAYTFLW